MLYDSTWDIFKVVKLIETERILVSRGWGRRGKRELLLSIYDIKFTSSSCCSVGTGFSFARFVDGRLYSNILNTTKMYTLKWLGSKFYTTYILIQFKKKNKLGDFSCY